MAGLEMNRTQALPSESSQSMAVKRNLFVCPTWPTMCQALCWPHYLPHYMGQLLASSSQLHGGGRGTWASGRLHISPQPYSKRVAKQGFALRSVCPHQMYALSYHTPQRENGPVERLRQNSEDCGAPAYGDFKEGLSKRVPLSWDLNFISPFY